MGNRIENQARRTEEDAAKYQQQYGTEEVLRLQLESVASVHRRVGVLLISLSDLSKRLRGQSPGLFLPTAPPTLT